MIPIFQEYEPNYLKAHLLWPFSKRYRNRVDLGKFPPRLRLIAVEVLVIRDPKILLVKNSKAGCTSAAHMFYQCFHGMRYKGDIHRPDIGLIQGENHLKEVHAALCDREAYKMTTVRHPVTRAISGFRDFFIDQKNLRAPLHMDAIRHFGFDQAAPQTRNFDAFLDMVEYSFAKNLTRTDRHFRSQVVNTAFSEISYDAICRLETLSADIITALKSAGVAQTAIAGISTEARNPSAAATFAPEAGQIDRIAQLYSEDFSAFDYDPENF